MTLWSPIRSDLPSKVQIRRKAKLPVKQKVLEPQPQRPILRYKMVEVLDSRAWAQVLQEVKHARICGLDLETTGLDPLSCRARLVQVSLPSGRVYVVDLWRLKGAEPLQDLGHILEDPGIKVIGHNLKFDLGFIQASCSRRLKIENIFDTMLASLVYWSGYYYLERTQKGAKNRWKEAVKKHTLEALAERHLGITLDKEYQTSDWSAELSSEQKEYAAKDVAVLFPLYDILQELLKRNSLTQIAELEFRALPSVIELELQGLPLDVIACRTFMEQKEAESIELAKALQAEAEVSGFKPRPRKGKKAGPDLLNPNSSIDLLDYLHSQGFTVASTGEKDLHDLVFDGCSFAERLLLYRRVSRQAKFAKEWLVKLSPIDGRLHGQYFQLGDKDRNNRAGRFSCKGPNLQQIPKRGKDGQAIRRFFKAPPGKKIVKGDLSGIELRIMAKLSGDKTMIEAFQAGQDLHKLTASKISGKPIGEITKEERQAAKAVNFLLIYGGQPELLQRRAKESYGVEMTMEEAEGAHRKFFETYPGVEAFHQKQKALKAHPSGHTLHVHEKGFYSLHQWVSTRTLLGRKRVWGQREDGYSLARSTMLFNSPSQGTGADLLKVIMAEVYSSLPPDVKMIASIHDEIVLEAPGAMAKDMADLLKEIMVRVGSEMLSPVPVDAEVEVLDSWGG